jgi:hypothetical protein
MKNPTITAELVYELREAQKRFFRSSNSADLAAAKRLEAKVDRELRKVFAPWLPGFDAEGGDG